MELPDKWRLSSVREFCSYCKGGTPFLKLEYSPIGIPVLAKGDIKPFGRLEHSEKRFVSPELVREKGLYLTQPGDLLMTSRDLTLTGDVLGLVSPALLNRGMN